MCGKKNNFKFNDNLEKIVGGNKSLTHEYPWQALVKGRYFFTTFTCGGAIISDEWILTAAHCIDGLDNII